MNLRLFSGGCFGKLTFITQDKEWGKMEEEYIAIPVKEYEHLNRCKQELIELHEAEIVNLRNQMQVESISSIVNSYVNN